ncbi:AAA family ATPase [Vibrio algivorus]|uniref:ATP-binding protein n=1 Tax=Vibrio algivorus TaxID=1667024 RepID=A0A557P9Q2_9VIBR|nr:ATP-binding protein [Vibrio algivorus]TVO37384.1 ATP-binding protein [Vibrio algivorus]
MALANFDRNDFFKNIDAIVSTSHPITSVEMLKGRDKPLERLQMSLNMTGRHAFIIGDRGVGKSSLAQTTAYLLQESGSEPIIVSCDPTSTLVGIANTVMTIAASNIKNVEYIQKLSVKLPWLISYEVAQENKTDNRPTLPPITDTLSATIAINTLSDWHSNVPVIVIDEFDQVPEKERQSFGIFLKQLGDKGTKVKLIFTGIGQSLNDLLDGHLSSHRQLHQEVLENLSWDARYDIIDSAMKQFGLTIDEDVKFKISGISDGFPNYIHLICEKILCVAFYKENVIKHIDFEIFSEALNDAVESVTETLRVSYDKATKFRPEHMHHILWAVADSADLQRNYSDIRESYHGVINSIDMSPLPDEKIRREFNKLLKDDHGAIIKRALSGRQGWFEFTENILRGFVRMHAERFGVTLDFKRNFTANTPTAKASTKHNYYRPSGLTPVERAASK